MGKMGEHGQKVQNSSDTIIQFLIIDKLLTGRGRASFPSTSSISRDQPKPVLLRKADSHSHI